MNKIYYVYRHINNINDVVFYVGKGTSGGKRGYDRKSENSPNRRNEKWIEYVKNIGYDYTYEVVREFDDEKDAYDFEFILQKYYWSIGQCQCSLMGGED
ncbi:hypothetical protein [Terrisporobacter sp.]|uniref:hypothetical protein n=1 Tax=Terrisporobacter sp. TaxID=1965305 RepID=UPI00261A3AD3|nr:hypothetical protein [Terrisporobacter sp.]